jgi:hypothetical protein
MTKTGKRPIKGRRVSELTFPKPPKRSDEQVSEEARALLKSAYVKKVQRDLAAIFVQIGEGKIPMDVFSRVRKHQNPFE